MANFNDSRRGMFIKACRFMVNVETLNINNVELSKEILQAVRAFPRLKNLSITSCNFDSKVKSSDIQKLGSLRLEKLSLLDSSDTLKFTYLIHAIYPPSLKELTSNSWEFMRTIASQTVDLDLETLVISQPSDTKVSFVELQNALERTPNLRCLKLLFSSEFHLNTNNFSLPDTSIPNLRVLSCPASLLPALVRTRPVNNISIVGYSQGFTSKVILAALKTSSGNISSLSVPIRVTLRSSFGDSFPQLKHLVVDCTDLYPEEYFFESVLQQLCDAHPVNNVLQTLETLFRDTSFEDADPSFRDLSLQYDTITSVILPKFPNLEEFSVSKYVKWTKVPGCSEWKAKVPLVVRPEVLQYLMVYEEGEGEWFGDNLILINVSKAPPLEPMAGSQVISIHSDATPYLYSPIIMHTYVFENFNSH
ncbi:hypothetical protein BDQ12DRAFT_725265 [Crucibulum laeve]|uniref:F-box domain-containing protein n=1 Tax=Crucibulum laeve TaxID=68775 RepID=A0A5C3LTV0_9AGAR|nr:hypothetical protein BDQ12DRAFT_725265 [Crucibulum laeve]